MDETARYRIRVRGRLDARWSSWFDGLAVEDRPEGDTVLSGVVPDQAALHGLIARVRDVGLALVSVERIEDRESDR